MALSQIEVIQEGLDGMHAMLDRAVPDMTADQWNARPAGEGVSAFFSLWHYVRTEDNIVNWVVHRRPTVWIDGGWDEHFSLHRTSQGTGMTKEEADAVQLTDVDAWLTYQQGVWVVTREWVSTLTDDDLPKEIVIRPTPPMSIWQALTGMLLYHGYRHVGEVEHARGLLGLGGLTI
jgi:hypothetical protein